MRRIRLSKPPQTLRKAGVYLDNIALVPASMLPYKEQWQRVANGLPFGGVLIVLPHQAKQQRVARAVASQFQERGQRVRVIDQAFAISTA